MDEHCDACGDPTASMHDTDAGQQVCPDCYTMTLKVERDAARKQLQGAVGHLQAARESLDDYPAIVAMHEEQTERAEAEVDSLRQHLRGVVEERDRLRAAISWARGQCTDEAPHTEIDAGLGRALTTGGGQ